MKKQESEKIEKEENKNDKELKKGFLKKVWYSIQKIEKYSELAAEGFTRAIKYFLLLVIILTAVASAVTVYRTSKQVRKIAKVIEEDAPEFTYSEGILNVDSQEEIINENDVVGKVIINTNAQTEEQINEYLNQIKDEEDAVIILKDRLILKESGSQQNIMYKYSTLFEELNIKEFNKETLVKYLLGTGMMSLYFNLFLVLFLAEFLGELLNIGLYVLAISIFGYLTTIILRLKMRYVAVFNMAVYSVTLSTLLYMAYLFVNAFISYRVNYFEIMYVMVSAIYMIAAIFILKTEDTKKQNEIQKVIEIEKEVKEEIKQKEEQEKKEEEKKQNKKNKKQTDDEDNKEEKSNGSEEPEGLDA